jgi:hypothetical protein
MIGQVTAWAVWSRAFRRLRAEYNLSAGRSRETHRGQPRARPGTERPTLSPGNYLRIDKHRRRVEPSIEKGLDRAVFLKQKPEPVFSGDFELHRFCKILSCSIAQSLLTHLVPSDIHTCLRNLWGFVEDGHVLFATFFEGDSSRNLEESCPHVCFHYSVEEMDAFGAWAGSRLTSVIGTIPGTR